MGERDTIVADCWKEIGRLFEEMEQPNKERINTFLWSMDESIPNKPETITFRRPHSYSAEKK